MKKNAKKLKSDSQNKVTYSESEMKRYLGVLSEMHGENLKGIRDGFVIINRKLDSHTEMIGSLVENMEIVKGDISTIKAGLKKKVDYDEFLSLVRRVQKIEAKM